MINIIGLGNCGNNILNTISEFKNKSINLISLQKDVQILLFSKSDINIEIKSNIGRNSNSKKKRNPIDRIRKSSKKSSDAKYNTAGTKRSSEIKPESVVDEEIGIHPVRNEFESSAVNSKNEDEATQTLKQFISAEPSTTAGEIRIK